MRSVRSATCRLALVLAATCTALTTGMSAASAAAPASHAARGASQPPVVGGVPQYSDAGHVEDLPPGEERLCPADSRPGYASCHAVIETQSLGTNPDTLVFPAQYQTPATIQSAYALPSTGGAGMTVGIVDAYYDPTAQSDLDTYRGGFGLPPCDAGCLTIVNQDGGTTLPTAQDTGWQAETSLDLEAVSAACPNCKIVLVEANDSYSDNLGAGVNTAASMGAKFISNSYGFVENGVTSLASFESSLDSTYYNHPGVVVTASTGDDDYPGDGNGSAYPAASPYVVSVGGTSLAAAANPRGWTETVWGSTGGTGAGSGCSLGESKPAYQFDSGCSSRMTADVSALADPATGLIVRNNGGWVAGGGTSLASPLIAAMWALQGPIAAGASAPSYLYTHLNGFNDITAGSNLASGTTCSVHPYFCAGGAGYDGPTGLGTPKGVGAFTAPAQTITSVSPNSGLTTRDTSITITGTGFAAGDTVEIAQGGGAWSGALPATAVNVVSPTTITATAPSGALTGPSDVFVVDASGNTTPATTSDVFTYTTPAPVVTAVSPAAGPLAGGTTVTITGTGFTGATQVRFGNNAATGVTVVSDTEIDAVSPAGSAGNVNVFVTTPAGTSGVKTADRFAYQAVPVVSGVSPVSGPTAGGTPVTITGTGFGGATVVRFGSRTATEVTVVSGAQITAVSPAASDGPVNVFVTTPGGTSKAVLADRFTYVRPPAITSVSPSSGPKAGGTTLTITGSGFTGATGVTFGSGGPSGTSVTVVNDTTITVVSPAHSTGQVNVFVTTAGGTSSGVKADRYTFTA